jgi:hypothetical protein
MTLSLTNQGFDYVAYYDGAYENADSLPALAATGANSVELSVEYGIDPHSSTVYADSNYTDGVNALGASIRQAVALGQSVMVRPLIDFVNPSDLTGTPYSVGDWRTYYNPGAAGSTTANAFFASYTTMILQQAQVAVANGATSLCIGTELDQITGPAYLSYWDTIINDLRANDPSLKLTYAADWDADLSPWRWGGSGLQAGTGNLATQVSFASQLDSIGIDCYAPLSDVANPTLAQLIAGWTQTPSDATALAVTGGQSLISYFEGVAAAIGKPLVFTELGYENATDAAAQPAGSSTNVVDSNLQAELYQAFFEAWQKAGNSSLTGVYFWNWDPNAGEVGPGEGANFSPQGLPAQAIVSDWFGSGPGITFNAPTVVRNDQVGLSGVASDGVGVQSVEIFSGATDLGAATLNAATGAWTFSTILPYGRYSFTALATDADGKQASALAPFVVSLAAPVGAVAPTISGTRGGQTTNGAAAITPFSGVTIGDANSGAVDTLSISLTGGGALAGAGLTHVSTGVYTLTTGSAAAVSAALRALVFTPAPGAPDTSATTSFALSDVSSAGTSVSASGATVVDVIPAVPAIAFNSDVRFSSRTSAILTGSVSDASGLTGLHIYDGSQDLGAAEINGDGSWSLAVDLAKGSYGAITAEATDIYGNTASTPAPYTLETGLAPPWSAYEADYDASGALVGEYFSTARGKTYLDDSVKTLTNCKTVYDYTGGAFFSAQDYSSYRDIYTPQDVLERETLFNDDGSHATTGYLNGQILQALADDTMTAAGEHETFRFHLNAGQDTITDFAATGRGHDLLSLPMTLAHDLGEILQDASQVGDNVFIAFGHGGSIILDNVAVDTISAVDFKFHGASA